MAIGEPLLATSVGLEWNEKEVLNEAAAAAKQNYRAVDFDDIRVVAYSYPKIAAQFLKGGNEVLMLEWKSWVEIPGSVQHERTLLTPSNFERWSLLDEMPEKTKQANVMNFKRRMDGWKTTRLSEFDFTTIKRKSFELPGVVIDLIDTHEVSYGACSSDHKPCFELRGQQTHVWCVAASVEMLLNFYRYQYSQARLARELGLGTCTSPNGLPYSEDAKIVEVIEKLTSGSLDATMHVNPDWTAFQSEIRANHPLISFIPGHSRTVAGYTRHILRPLA